MTALVLFDEHGGWGETLVCDAPIRERLRRLGVGLGRWSPPPGSRWTPQQLRRSLVANLPAGEAQVRYVADGAALFLFPCERGWAGLLCEAGDWLVLPARLRHAIDAGEHPAGSVVRVLDVPGVAPATLPAELPRHAAFVERLLLSLGESNADEEASD